MQRQRDPVVILDFDGTIADSIPAMLDVVHVLLDRQVDREDVSRLRGKSSIQLLKELKVPLWRVYFLIVKARRLITEHIHTIPLVPGMDEAVRQLSGQFKLYLVSANSSDNVRAFLNRFGLAEYFTHIQGGVAPWRKRHALRRLARTYGIWPENAWYVGDEDMDIKSAHQAGMKAVAVSWGFSNIHVLEQQHPEILVFNSDELVQKLLGGDGNNA